MDYTWGNVAGSPYHKLDEEQRELSAEHIAAMNKKVESEPDPWEGVSNVNYSSTNKHIA